ncbi:MAG: hypothetical protein RBS37_05450 [Bacteroidales bacterium]|jgi:hypothetical protein|nr:hypothetical protein [Bacteroidales bacterium]
MRKERLLPVMLLVVLATACVKDTYDMNRLSEKMLINPTFAVSAASGEVTLGDIIEANDTIGFDENDLLKIWIREDSVVDISLDSLIDFSEKLSFSESYAIGPVKMGDISTGYSLTLDEISQGFDPALRAQFIALDDDSPHPFPAFPPTNTGSHTLSPFANFEYAVLSGGRLDIDVTNNLTAPVSGITITIRNADDDVIIGAPVDIPVLAPAGEHSTFIDLTGKRLYKTIKAELTVNGSPGTIDPVMIRMTDDILFEVQGSDIEVESGRLIVPSQLLSDPGAEEMVSFDPGDGIEITELKLIAGTINYLIDSDVEVKADLAIVLPTITRQGITFSEAISVNPAGTASGSFPASDLTALLNTNPLQPYNSLPAQYEVTISSLGNLIDFSAYDSIRFEASITGLDIDYVKGFFGQMTETIENDTINLDIQEILDRITGDFYFADPRLTLDYSNSFGLPVGITLEAAGKKDDQTVDLDAGQFVLDYPVFPIRTIESSYTIDRSNSSLPELISLPPTSIIIGGTAALNPNPVAGVRDNYIFGDSRFVAAVEALVPADFWVNNLQFADTLENFLKPEDEGEDFSLADLGYFRLDLMVTNGFPLGTTVIIILHDTITGIDLYELEIEDFIEPAPVNTEGRVTTPSEKVTRVVLEKDFFEATEVANAIVVKFTLNTTGSGTQSVKIYSDYSISFKIGIVVKPDLILN